MTLLRRLVAGAAPMTLLRRLAAGAALAISFLTVVPVRARVERAGLGAAAAWFPAVGALVGLAAGAVRYATEPALGPGVAAALALVVLVALTGALHQDGLADCADGLGARGDRETRLRIMRDPTVGAFGVLAIALWAILLTTAVAELPRHDAIGTLVLAGALGRWCAVLHAAALGPARRDGLGAAFAVEPIPAAIATATALAAVLLLRPGPGLAAAGAALAVTVATSAWAHRALGGRTGDTLGATVALAEVAVCLTLLGFAR